MSHIEIGRIAGSLLCKITEKEDLRENKNSISENLHSHINKVDSTQKNSEAQEGKSSFYLVGELKEPCSFLDYGFKEVAKEELNTIKDKYFIPLKLESTVNLENCESKRKKRERSFLFEASIDKISSKEFLKSTQKNEQRELILRHIYDCFIIKRNGSVSERICELLLNPLIASDPTEIIIEERGDGERKNIEWLFAMPLEIWDIVREQVLRCL